MDVKLLIERYFMGDASEDDVAELSRAIEESEELRRQFIFASRVDSALRERSIERALSELHGMNDRSLSHVPRTIVKRRYSLSLAALAATLLIASVFWINHPRHIASIASSEDAAWESELPTNVGADLTAGQLELKTGLSTIKFRSGAELLVEAPARLELLGAMRASLISGAAVMNVPDTAKGFVLETPNGYAVDYGTRFSVQVDEHSKTSDFALIEGKIELHHSHSGDSELLSKSGESALVSTENIVIETDSEDANLIAPVQPLESELLRVSTAGRCRSVVRFEKFQERRIAHEFLYVKTGNNPNWDYKSFFEFDVRNIERKKIENARLRLNLVPSPYGVSSLLPKISRFAVYGITAPAMKKWNADTLWSESPVAEDGVLLGTFEIPRSQERGVVGIEGESLLSFIRDHGDTPVSFLVVRETGKEGGVGKVLVHTFASDSHPESVGPQLELNFR